MNFLARHNRLALPPLMAVTLLLAGNSHAAPTINQLSLRGLQTGATTTLAIEGADLPPDTKVLLPVPIAKQELKPSTGTNRIEVEITLDATVTPGIYPLRSSPTVTESRTRYWLASITWPSVLSRPRRARCRSPRSTAR